MRTLALAALLAACSDPKPVTVIDLDTALLVGVRDHLAICLQPDPQLAPIDARVLDDVALLAREHPDWSPAGLDRNPARVALGCPGALPLDRAFDPKRDVLGPGLLAEPSPYRVHLYVIGDAALLDDAPFARVPAELAQVDDQSVAEVSTALVVPAGSLGTPGFRDALAASLGLAPVEVARERIIDAIPASAYVVNGHALNATERAHVRTLGRQLRHLPAATRLQIASRSAWWSLKEGVLDLANPVVYSNCHFATGDARIGPLEVCPQPSNPWQVGIAAIQVPNHSDASVAAMAQQLFPDRTPAALLASAAALAGFEPSSATHQAIVASTGRLRRSWLLRVPALAMALIEPEITWECITNAFSWCYGTAWDTTARYAPNRAAALRAMADLQQLLVRFP